MAFSFRPRARLLLASAGVASMMLASACSGDEPSPAPSPSTTTAPTTSTPPPFTVTGAGVSGGLQTTLTALYGGGKVAATKGTVTTELAGRTPLTDSIEVKGQVKRFKKTPIAVATYQKDVTLLVQSGRTWTVVGGWWPSLGIAARVPAPTMRILAIGSDARPNQTPGKYRADALQIIGVDAKGVGGIAGIPRDSYVPLSTGGRNKINAAMVFGGVDAQVKTVQSATGVKIDGYVMTGFKGFEDMINAIGGLAYTSPGSLTSHVGKPLLKKGLNKLAGITALNFARERKNVPGGDFGRSANQARIIITGIAIARDAGPINLPTYLQAFATTLQTDLTAAEVLVLSSAIYRTDPGKIKTKVAVGGFGTAGGQSVVLVGSDARAVYADILDARLG